MAKSYGVKWSLPKANAYHMSDCIQNFIAITLPPHYFFILFLSSTFGEDKTVNNTVGDSSHNRQAFFEQGAC